MKIIGFAQLRNELEKGNLENWFKCMLPICDYIYIYDQNSTDGSVNYYNKFSNVVVIRSITNRFKEELLCKSELLNKVKLEHPDTDWIFWMDGDTLLDGRLLKNEGNGFKELCESLKDDSCQGYLFGHKNLWRSDIYWRKDSLFNWLDENGVCALWRFKKDICFAKNNGLHGRQWPSNINDVSMLPFKLIHRGFATDYQIITKFNLYKDNGQCDEALDRLLDESTLDVEKIEDYLLPDWFEVIDTILPTGKRGIKDIMMDSNIVLDHRHNEWELRLGNNTYFDCGNNYEAELKSKYGKFKHPIAIDALISMGLKDGVWGKEYNNVDCFRDIEVEGENWNILEIGCGFGGFGAMLAPFVKQYHGVDISTHIVNKGNEAIFRCGIENMYLIDVINSTLSQFLDNSYDMIFSTAVFIHTEKEVTEYYLKETKRLLKSNGIFIHHLNLSTESSLNEPMNKVYMVEECEEMFTKAGLNILCRRDGIDFKEFPSAFMRYNCGVKN